VSVRPYLAYLRAKYGEIYRLPSAPASGPFIPAQAGMLGHE
jgi:hypothetical protein